MGFVYTIFMANTIKVNFYVIIHFRYLSGKKI